jgi:hypothetical protein
VAAVVPHAPSAVPRIARERDHLDEAALLEKERREPAAGGEKLRDLADNAVGEMKTGQRQEGAETGIARRLAEPGKHIGDCLHDEVLSHEKGRPRRPGGGKEVGGQPRLAT